MIFPVKTEITPTPPKAIAHIKISIKLFAKFPSLLFINPLGGQTGEGDGVSVAFALASDVTDAAPAAGMHMDSTITSAINFLITIPLKLTNAKEDADS